MEKLKRIFLYRVDTLTVKHYLRQRPKVFTTHKRAHKKAVINYGLALQLSEKIIKRQGGLDEITEAQGYCPVSVDFNHQSIRRYYCGPSANDFIAPISFTHDCAERQKIWKVGTKAAD